ncbi:MAG: ElyC/SanA/YdcF family protein [Gemmatimonadota bacterium]|nr:ElyC/SanA/YdcF family protein [Gemmatimonadota bacterium]
MAEEQAVTPPKKKSGVLVHGCNLHTYQWKRIVWGKPPYELGRVPKGIFIALQEKADVMVFGTGASEKDGLLEADATARLMWDKFDDLKDFAVFETHFPDLKDQAFRDQCRTRIKSILKIENTSQNTVDEVTRAGHIFKDYDIEQIILVSSPTHLPRCLRDACVAFDNDLELSHFRYWLSASPSITGYMGRSAADVAIFEPPHRPDRPPFNINDFLKRVNDIPGSGRQDFLRRFDELLQDFDV